MSLNGNPFSCPAQEPCALLPLNTAFAFIFAADFLALTKQSIPSTTQQTSKGFFLLLFVQMILLSFYSREEGRILKRAVPIKFLSFQPSFQRVLEMMELEMKYIGNIFLLRFCGKAFKIQQRVCPILQISAYRISPPLQEER